ncbi:MAG: hypothetical protein HFH47_03515 [Bacilli bacterium]|nr:hypothetical protein [Bacilli bacterium]
MYGAIIGDLAGSMYEYFEYKDFENDIINSDFRKLILNKPDLLDDRAFYTDDTILTIAILDCVLNRKSYSKTLKEYGLKYKLAVPEDIPYFKYMFSPRFIAWCEGKKQGDSYGNGAAMRISPIGYLFDDKKQICSEVIKATRPSHSTSQAINGAEAVALTIYMARKNINPDLIKEYIINRYGFDLNYDFDNLLCSNTFNCSCEETVKQSLYLLFSSNSFKEAVQKAISIGGDTDTIASITGSMAEALFGIPNDLIKQANEFLPLEFKANLVRGYSKIKKY